MAIAEGHTTAFADKKPRNPEAVGVALKKLSYKEKREFESLGQEISSLENEKTLINQRLSDPGTGFEALEQLSRRIEEIGFLLDKKELRWLELSESDR